MPEDRTTPYGEPALVEKVRRPDRIVGYAQRGMRQLALVIAAAIAFVVLLEVLFYEVIGDRGDLSETVRRGLVVALVPVTLLLISIRQKR